MVVNQPGFFFGRSPSYEGEWFI